MENKAAVAEEGLGGALGDARVWIGIVGLEGVRGDLAVLAREIANLAGLRGRGVTWWSLAADEGVEMAERGGAAAVGADGFHVDVVGYVGC